MFRTQPVFSATQVREIDARVIAASGDDGYALMCRAATFSLRVLQKKWPSARSLCVLAGPGNNGGDALVLARLAQAQGYAVQTHLLGAAPERLCGAAQQAWAGFQGAGGQLESGPPGAADVVVDGLFGTGLSRELRGEVAGWIALVDGWRRQRQCGVLALDIPSGLCADTGRALGPFVRADHCCSFVGRKLGHYLGDAIDACGELHFDDLGVPPAAGNDLSAPGELLEAWSPAGRPRSAHKGDTGHVLCVGGQPEYAGALVLAAAAALRVGAGKVSLLGADATPHPAQWPEMMRLGPLGKAELIGAAAAVDALCVGPGLGRGDESRMQLEILRRAPKPQVWDADALWALAHTPALLPADVVLTPHPGEAATLLGCSSAEIQGERLAALENLVQKYRCVVVLKGARTLVGGPGHQVCVVPQGYPGMAVGGMGDALAGLIAGLRAQGLSAWDAARAGAWCLAATADCLRQRRQNSLLAHDIVDALGWIWTP